MAFNPENVSYSQQMVADSAAGQQLADGNYKFVVDSTTIDADKNGNIVAINRVSPLDPEDGVTRKKPSMYLRVTLPLVNGDLEDHTPPDWAAGIAGEFLRAVAPEDHPFAPRKRDDAWQYNGEEIDPSEVDDKKLEASDFVFQTCRKWCQNPDLFKESIFYGKVVTKEETKGTFTNIKTLRPELPPGDALTPLEAFKARGKLTAKAQAPVAKTNGKPAMAPAKAKGKK